MKMTNAKITQMRALHDDSSPTRSGTQTHTHTHTQNTHNPRTQNEIHRCDGSVVSSRGWLLCFQWGHTMCTIAVCICLHLKLSLLNVSGYIDKRYRMKVPGIVGVPSILTLSGLEVHCACFQEHMQQEIPMALILSHSGRFPFNPFLFGNSTRAQGNGSLAISAGWGSCLHSFNFHMVPPKCYCKPLWYECRL